MAEMAGQFALFTYREGYYGWQQATEEDFGVVRRGDLVVWNGSLCLKVRRVARDQSWADCFVTGIDQWDAESPVGWSKRVPLPFGNQYERFNPRKAMDEHGKRPAGDLPV